MHYVGTLACGPDDIYHFGIKGMKWGIYYLNPRKYGQKPNSKKPEKWQE